MSSDVTARPSREDVDAAYQLRLQHQPTDGQSGEPCTECDETWPCPTQRHCIEVETLAYGWAWDAVAALPDRFADRVSAEELAPVREYVNVGEWGEALDLLIAVVRQLGVAVSDAECAELQQLARAMRLR